MKYFVVHLKLVRENPAMVSVNSDFSQVCSPARLSRRDSADLKHTSRFNQFIFFCPFFCLPRPLGLVAGFALVEPSNWRTCDKCLSGRQGGGRIRQSSLLGRERCFRPRPLGRLRTRLLFADVCQLAEPQNYLGNSDHSF